MLSSSMHLLSILLLAAVSRGCAQTALSAWTSGVATNYGGPDDGDSPTEATFGRLDVSTFVPHACGVFTCTYDVIIFSRASVQYACISNVTFPAAHTALSY